MKEMVDTTEKLILGQTDKIYGMMTINWEDSFWKHLPLVSDGGSHQSLAHKVLLFSDSSYPLER